MKLVSQIFWQKHNFSLRQISNLPCGIKIIFIAIYRNSILWSAHDLNAKYRMCLAFVEIQCYVRRWIKLQAKVNTRRPSRYSVCQYIDMADPTANRPFKNTLRLWIMASWQGYLPEKAMKSLIEIITTFIICFHYV